MHRSVWMKATTLIRRSLPLLAALLASAQIVSAKEPLFNGLGSYTHRVTTRSPEAQRYFNQGLAFYHGFNHGAAIRSFQQAAELDPKRALAYWGSP
jgi:hypothetical protein